MTYTSLYRELRPRTFEEVVGQDAIIKTLKNQIVSGRLSHAYLFTGTRGTGKTSTAKIFARAINCQNGIEGNPCNQCENCRKELEGSALNIMEIDAASNNGVENIRELREDVRYQPADAPYKIYIIDEVHMLSIGAFNALLKTLEEPPAHVVFILATTDPHKIPETILSRVQRYDFRRISNYSIREVMKIYLDKQGIIYEDSVLRWIAKMADGALRDAYSILDRCLAFYMGEELTLEKVLKLLGAVDNSIYEKLTQYLIEHNIVALLEETEDIMMQGRDIQQLIQGFISFLRDILIVKVMPNAESFLDLPAETYQVYQQIAQMQKENFFQTVIKELSATDMEMKNESNKRILLELLWIKLCSPELNKDTDNMQNRLEALERKVAELPTKVIEVTKTEEKKKELPKLPPIDIKAFPEDVKQVIRDWKDLDFPGEMMVDTIIKMSTPFYDKEKNNLLIVCGEKVAPEYMTDQGKMDLFKEFLANKYQKHFGIEVLTEEAYTNYYRRSVSEVKDAVESLKEAIDFKIEVK